MSERESKYVDEYEYGVIDDKILMQLQFKLSSFKTTNYRFSTEILTYLGGNINRAGPVVVPTTNKKKRRVLTIFLFHTKLMLQSLLQHNAGVGKKTGHLKFSFMLPNSFFLNKFRSFERLERWFMAKFSPQIGKKRSTVSAQPLFSFTSQMWTLSSSYF